MRQETQTNQIYLKLKFWTRDLPCNFNAFCREQLPALMCCALCFRLAKGLQYPVARFIYEFASQCALMKVRNCTAVRACSAGGLPSQAVTNGRGGWEKSWNTGLIIVSISNPVFYHQGLKNLWESEFKIFSNII